MMDGSPPLGTKTPRSDSQSVINEPRRRIETGQQDLVANHMLPILASHLNIVDEIQGGIELIKAEVEEARLIVGCLKKSIQYGRNLSSDEYDAMFSQYDAILSQFGDRINIGYVRNFTTLADFTQEKAKAELQHAEMKLEKAKAELQHAKAELKDAEVKLNYNETYGEESDIGSVLAQSKYLSLRLLASGKAEDMDDFADFMSCEWEDLLKVRRSADHIPLGKQYTKAIVLRSASGVGKTYASLTATYPLYKNPTFGYFPIAVYIGLNTICPLTEVETNRLNAKGEPDLRHVLLRRLLIQLNYLASPDVNIDESLWDTTTGVQKMPVPANGWDGCNLHFQSSIKFIDLENKLTSLLATITKKAGKPVMLFPIVDEGQFLDEICPKKGEEVQGARWALRLFRQLQLNNDILGMMTGIDPDVHTGSTNGTNVTYRKALHDPTGFTAIAKALFHSHNYTGSQVARIAAAYYPIVRDLQVVSCGRRPNPCRLDTLTDVSKQRTASLLLASGLGLWVDKFAWTEDVPAMFSYTLTGSYFLPTLGIRHVAAVAEDLGGISCDVDFMNFAAIPDPQPFESVTSFCLSMLLVLTNYKYKYPSLTMQSAALSRSVLEWLGTNVQLSFKRTISPEDSSKAYFPSSLCTSHTAAFTVNGVHTPRLHPAFILDGLSKVGDTVLMKCGGNAPVDMIFVTLIEKGDGTSRGRLHIRLCDAKLVKSSKNRVDGLDAMPGRFKMVKEYLEYHLEKEINYKADFSKHAIVTTATGDTMPEGMIAFSPATCKFAPITDWWFACAPKGGNATS